MPAPLSRNKPYLKSLVGLFAIPNNQTHTTSQYEFFNLAGEEGFEPPILGPEPSALPLGHSPSSKRTLLSRFASRQKLRPKATLLLSNLHTIAKAPWFVNLVKLRG